jgi:hypothetical protein
MKFLLAIFLVISSLSCFSNEIRNTHSKNKIDDSIDVSRIKKLRVGEQYFYITYRTSCLSGDLFESLDSVCIFRDSINVKIEYKNKVYSLDENKINAISLIELKILSVQNAASTTYLNYIFKEAKYEAFLGSDGGNIWDEIIELITSWT